MKRKLLVGLLAALLVMGAGCAAESSSQRSLPEEVILMSAGTAVSDASIALTVNEEKTLTLNPLADRTVEVSTTGALRAERMASGEITLMAEEAGAGSLTVTCNGEGKAPLIRTFSTQAEWGTQTIGFELLPDFGESSLRASTGVRREGDALVLAVGVQGEVVLTAKPDTVFELGAVPETVEARLEDEHLMLKVLSAGSFTVEITAKNERFQTAEQRLSVVGELPPVGLTLVGAGMDVKEILPLAPGGTAQLSVQTDPKDAKITVTSDGDCVQAAYAGGILRLAAAAEGTARVTVTAAREGFSDTTQTISAEVAANRLPIELHSPTMDSARAIVLDKGGQAVVTVALPQGGEIAQVDFASPNDALTMQRKENQLIVTAQAKGTARLTVVGHKEGKKDGTQWVTFVCTGTLPQLPLRLPKSLTLQKGESKNIFWEGLPGEAEVTVASGNPTLVAARREAGGIVVQGLAGGATTLTVTARLAGYADRTESISLTVVAPPPKITVSSTALTGQVGEPFTIPYSVTENVPVDVEISPEIASVSCANGILTVKPLSNGNATISLYAGKRENNPARCTLSLTIQDKDLSLTLSPSMLHLMEGDEGMSTITCIPSDAHISVSVTGGVIADHVEDQIVISATEYGTVVVRAEKSGYQTATQTIVVQVSAKPKPKDCTGYADEVFNLVNQRREENGLSPLTRMSDLDQGAQTRAEEIEQKFSHTRPNGESFYSVYGVSENYNYGENIAYGQRTPEEVMRTWMDSSGHRANILGSDYVGLGVGVYEEKGTIYWAQHFYTE